MGWMVRTISAAMALAAFAAADAQTPSALDSLIAAERAFADYTAANGVKRGFLAYSADQAFSFRPGPTPIRPHLQAMPDAVPPGEPLRWWPLFAGVANSGDLGFTSGAVNGPTRYFTVWLRQEDGRWRWVYDGGVALAARLPGSPTDPVVRLAPAADGAGSPELALAELARIENQLAEHAARDAAAAHRAWLADGALVAGSPVATLPRTADHESELARWPAQVFLRRQGGVASREGDLAFTWGELRWRDMGWWLIYPIAYLAFTLVQGPRVGWYPYPFIDVNAHGYAQIAINSAALFVFFAVVSAILIGIDRVMARPTARQAV